MEAEFQAFLSALGKVQKGLDLYSRGQRREGNLLIDAAMAEARALSKGPEWPDFFSQVADYLASLEMADLGRMQNLAPAEAGLLKKYGLGARDLLQLRRFYAGFRALDRSVDLPALFSAPATLVDHLGATTAAVQQEIDRARSLPRKLKKAAKGLAGSRLTHLLVGSALIGMNLLWQKEQQTSVSIGAIFLTAAVKK
ncbi:MAG TPA: hypothetical protein PKI62_09235 [bacterium]|nr:hypothetical protein [bacterium]HPR88299.1 hypothetical protein [bacterium]